jgi:hypothetical protein
MRYCRTFEIILVFSTYTKGEHEKINSFQHERFHMAELNPLPESLPQFTKEREKEEAGK